MQTAAEDEEMEEEEEERRRRRRQVATWMVRMEGTTMIGDQGWDGMAVSIGGVRVVLSAEDRDAVASNVECLM
jgi:SOS-response transcriptional repressor LexA